MATFTYQSKNSTSWAKQSHSPGTAFFLLLENGGHILQEDGVSRLILEPVNTLVMWSKQTKN